MPLQRSLRPLAVEGVRLPAASASPGILSALLLICLIELSSYSEGLRFGLNLPVRTPVAVLLFLVVFFQAASARRRVVTLPLGWWIIALWGLMAVWIAGSNVVKGAGFLEIPRRLTGRDFTSFSAMFAIIWCARGRSRQEWITMALGGLIALSAFVGVMQWLDQGWAWRLPLLINVPQKASEFGDLAEFTPEMTLVSGLFGTAFFASYYLAIGTVLLLPMLLDARWRFFVVVPFLLVLINLVILQERSAVLSAAVCSIPFFFGLLRRLKGRTFGVVLLLTMMGAGGLFAARLIAHSIASGSARYGLYRYGDFSSASRVVAITDAIDTASRNLLMGTSAADIEAGWSYGAANAPHNLLANALLYHGLPALAIVLAIAGLQTWLAWTVWRAAWPRSDYAALGCALAMWAYLCNCQFHNASMLNGDYPGWWLTGLLIAARQNYQEEDLFRYPTRMPRTLAVPR